MGTRWIHKVGAAVVDGGRLLVVRKRGLADFILPGGKPEGDETALETLSREVAEELGCDIANASLARVFTDVAAGDVSAVVVVRLYAAELVGDPRPMAEIEELAWIPTKGDPGVPLAPSIVNGILPFLRRKPLGRGSANVGERPLQGAFELV
jgi:8-oxo-dGTP diphosphatase